jgi:hypothetical protein
MTMTRNEYAKIAALYEVVCERQLKDDISLIHIIIWIIGVDAFLAIEKEYNQVQTIISWAVAS